MEQSIVGRRLIVKGDSKSGRVYPKYEVTPDNISQVLLMTGIENLPKYKTEIQQFFCKGHIANLGDCYIDITSYFFNNLYKFDNIACLKLRVMPFSNRTRVYKILINSKDLKYYFNIDYPNLDSSKNLLLITKFITQIALYRQTLYSCLNIPISNHHSLICPKYSYALYTKISNNIESSSTGAKVEFKRFLRPKLLESKIIIQCTIKINGYYIIITVEHHKMLKCWSLILYFPRLCRRFVTYFYSSDLLAMKTQFVESLSPSATQKLESKSAQKNYAIFTSECLQQVLTFKIINELDKKDNLMMGIEENNNLYYSTIHSNSADGFDSEGREQKISNSYVTHKSKIPSQKEEVKIIDKIDFYELKVMLYYIIILIQFLVLGEYDECTSNRND